MGLQAAADFEAVKFVQSIIGLDRYKLQNLVECGVGACSFSIVENAAYQVEPRGSRARTH
jgi:hypothetical protein